jgi:serine protease Do
MPRARRAAGLLLAGALAASTAAGADEGSRSPSSAECREPLPAIFRHLSPAVVSISAGSTNSSDVQNRFDRGEGSGVVIDSPGLVLTNAHVVLGREFINVSLGDGSILTGRLIGADPLLDIALVRVIPHAGISLPAARLGDSDHVAVGEDIFAFGYPYGLDPTLSRGIVSAVNRPVPGTSASWTVPMIQTDAPIHPGTSGGPLVNACGEVIGITTSVFSEARDIGFAIPINLIKSAVPALLEDGRVVRPWLGLRGEVVSQPLKDLFRIPLVDGFLVETVDPGSPAEKAGVVGGKLEVVVEGHAVLLGGDIVTRIDGTPVNEVEELVRAINSFKVGATVRLTLFRSGLLLETDCVLTERPLPASDLPSRSPVAPTGTDGPQP